MSLIYQNTVLSKGPFYFARLDESSGTSITDLSGNDYPGTFNAGVVLGVASPIETDSGSRAAGLHVGIVTAPAPTGAWSMGGWLYASSTQDVAIVGRNGQFGLSGGNFLAWDSGANQIRGFASNSGAQVEVNYTPGATDTWYRVLLTRSGNVVRLYVNAILRDEDTGFSVAAMDGAWSSVGTWKLGCLGDSGNLGNLGGAIDEVDLYDYALTVGDELEIYESALADLPLSATITVRVVVELDTDDVEPIDFPFAHNFAEPLSGNERPIVEHLAFKTNDLRSQPDYSQRINAQPHHIERTLEYFVTPTSARARAMLQSALWTPGQTYKLPIGRDWGTLTAQATGGADTLSLDTTLRDYEIGSLVVVWQDVYRPWTAQFFEITSRTDTELGITPDVGDTLPAGSTVMPARLAILPEESLSVDSHLIDRETHALQFEILSTELSSRRVTEYTPSETYRDIEIFNLERAKVEWVDPNQYSISRRFQQTGTPTGNDYSRAIDTGSPQTIPIRLLFASREAVSEFYGWLEARQGKQNPVWIVSQEADLEVIARSNEPDTITINYIGYASRYNAHHARRYLAFLLTNGTYSYKQIASAVDNGNSTETLTLDLDPPLFADIAKVSFLKFCIAPDQSELKYHRDGSDFIAECEVVFTELLTTPD